MEATRHPLDSIAGIHDSAPETGDPATRGSEPANETVPAASDDPTPPGPALSLESIQLPALLIDRRLRVAWQNQQARDKIWRLGDEQSNHRPAPELFDLLFEPRFQRQVNNWRRWTTFFVQQARSLVPVETWDQRLAAMTDRQKSVILPLLERIGSTPNRQLMANRERQVLHDGRVTVYDVVVTEFSEGRLLVFDPFPEEETDAETGTCHLARHVEVIRCHPGPVKLPLTVLAANLNNAFRLNFEMLPDEYSLLVSSLCQRSIKIIERYGGIFNKHLDCGFFAFFIQTDDDPHHALKVIDCCLELRTQCAELSREWKVRKSWPHEIELNMGIHKACEHVGILKSRSGELISNSGSAMGMATCLARMAQSGQIWATKALFDEMPSEVYRQLRFGIMNPERHTHRIFVQKCFQAISELPDLKSAAASGADGLEQVAVTQVFGRQP